MPTTGGTPVVLHAGTQGRPFSDVAWNSDETQIALVELIEAAPKPIIVVNLSTGTARTIVDSLDLVALD